jgi:hypothetical protein
MKTALVSLICLSSLSMLSSCGTTSNAGRSAGGPASRPNCGGDVVGTWTVTSSNLSIDVSKMGLLDCPLPSGTGNSVTMTGIGTYRGDGTYTQVGSLTGSLTINLPAPCLRPGLTCAALAQAFIGEMFGAATCDVAGDGCTCKVTLDPKTHTLTGTYTTPSVGVISETDTGASTGDLTDYCVEGTTMVQSIRPRTGDGLSGSMVLKKQ